MEKSLKEKAAKGLAWSGLNNVMQQLLNLLFGIALARMLSPADYGMVGMLMIFSLLAGALQESGFTAALINRREVRHRDYNAVFWFSLSAGLSLYAILFLSAPLIAIFYHQPQLTALSRFAFLSFVIGNLGIVPNAILMKQLKVKQNALVQLTALTLSGLLGIIMAWAGMAYWGLATQSVVYATVVMAGRWLCCKWRPTLRIDLTPLREMMGFSVKVLAANMVTHINNNILTVLLGRFYTPYEVGNFNQANKWNSMGYYTIQSMMGSVAQPVLHEVEEDRQRQLRVFRKMLRFLAFISMPCMLGLSAVAPELITLAITDKWAACARLMQIVCIGGAFIPLHNLMYNLNLSRGRSDVCLWCTLAFGMVQLLAVVLCRSCGVEMMVWVFTIVNVLWVLPWWYQVRRLIGLTLREFLSDVLLFTAIAALSMLVACQVASLADGLAATLAIKVAVAAVSYFAILWLIGDRILRESIEELLVLLRKR